MIIELASIVVKAGEESAFEAGVAKAVDLVRQAKGCKGIQLNRCIEQPSRYNVVIHWETLENHTVDFRGSDLFTQWRALVGPFFAEAPDVKHFTVSMQPVHF